MATHIGAQQIDDIAYGAAVLGCGGGGDPYIGALMARQALLGAAAGAPTGSPTGADGAEGPGPGVTLLAPHELADDAHVAVIAGIGAPPVLIEKIANGSESAWALQQLERRLGHRFDCLMPAEIGGLNSLYPIALAAQTGLPVVDADGMGRAFPRLEMTTFHIHRIRATPLALVNGQGDQALIETEDDAQLERLIGALCIAMGGFMSSAGYPQRGSDVRRAAVPGTVSICLALGQAWRRARAAHRPVMPAVLAALHATPYYAQARQLFEGKVVDVARQVDGRFSFGRVVVQGIGSARGTLELQLQNEFLAARLDGRMLAGVPDLISVLDHDTAQPITAEALRYGHRVRVLAADVPPVMRTPEALAVWGPRAFGIDEDYIPIEQRLGPAPPPDALEPLAP